MEAPTTTRRAASSARMGTFSSARMLEAQRMFQSVVKKELQLLLVGGTKREEAVKLLLRRIVASTEPPDAAAVRGVMREFQMDHDDAVRALIVKQELGRLKRQGLDSFAAIEELTRKMKSRDVGGGNSERSEEEEVQEEMLEVTKTRATDSSRDVMPAAEIASPTADKDGQETSLSLIQRIGQVSISSSTTPESEHEACDEGQDKGDTNGVENGAGKERNETLITSPLRVQSPTNTTLAHLTPQSRKRRAAFSNQVATVTTGTTRSVKPVCSSLKKQKICTEGSEKCLPLLTRKPKQTPLSLSKSTTATGSAASSPSSGRGGGPTRGDHKTKILHKRQRKSAAGMQDEDESPIGEDLCVAHVHHRHHGHPLNKRQKSSSLHGS